MISSLIGNHDARCSDAHQSFGKNDSYWALLVAFYGHVVFVQCFIKFRTDKVSYFFGQNHLVFSQQNLPAGNYMFKVNNRNTRRRCKICSKFSRSGAFIINFKHFSHNIFIVNFEQVNAGIRMLNFGHCILSIFYNFFLF